MKPLNHLFQGLNAIKKKRSHVRVALSYILGFLLRHLLGSSRTLPGLFVLARAPPDKTSPLRRGGGERRLRLLAGFSWRPWLRSIWRRDGGCLSAHFD